MAGTKRSREGYPLFIINRSDSDSNSQPAADESQTAMAVAADTAMADVATETPAAAEPVEKKKGVGVDDTQQRQIQLIFENFRDELDEHYDRRERIVKATRDVTALSKKMYGSPLNYLKWCPSMTLCVNVANSIRVAEYSPCSG